MSALSHEGHPQDQWGVPRLRSSDGQSGGCAGRSTPTSERGSRGQSVSRGGSGRCLARRSNRIAAEIGHPDPSSHPVAWLDESVRGRFLDLARRRIALVSFAPGNPGDPRNAGNRPFQIWVIERGLALPLLIALHLWLARGLSRMQGRAILVQTILSALVASWALVLTLGDVVLITEALDVLDVAPIVASMNIAYYLTKFISGFGHATIAFLLVRFLRAERRGAAETITARLSATTQLETPNLKSETSQAQESARRQEFQQESSPLHERGNPLGRLPRRNSGGDRALTGHTLVGPLAHRRAGPAHFARGSVVVTSGRRGLLPAVIAWRAAVVGAFFPAVRRFGRCDRLALRQSEGNHSSSASRLPSRSRSKKPARQSGPERRVGTAPAPGNGERPSARVQPILELLALGPDRR